MKKILLSMIMIIICASLLTSCNNINALTGCNNTTALTSCDNINVLTGYNNTNVTETCDHNWVRTENSNEYTAVEKCSICDVTRRYTDPDSIPDPGYEEGVNLIRYNWDGIGIKQKGIYTCDLGYAIIDCLSKLQETGDIIPVISEDAKIEFSGSQPIVSGRLPIERGTVWIDCGSVGLFRLNPEMTEICIVETHFGEGKVLQMTDTLESLLSQAWYYHPYDYWYGNYENNTVTLQQVYKAVSAVEHIKIEDMYIIDEIDSKNNKIVLNIQANESKKVMVCLKSYHSDDNIAGIYFKEIDLISGEEITLEFTFPGFYNYTYWVSIMIDNTQINMAINPKDTK